MRGIRARPHRNRFESLDRSPGPFPKALLVLSASTWIYNSWKFPVADMDMSSKVSNPFDINIVSRLLEAGAHRLMQHPWFETEWLFSVHPYPPAPAEPECVTLHVYRPGWFNDDRQGIHFETFIGAKQWQRRELSIAMHIFHCPHIPGTSIPRRKVSRPFIDEVYDLVSSWPGYSFRAGRYGTHPFTHVLSFDVDMIEHQLEAEFSRLCLQLGPVMDRTLDAVLQR